MLTYGTPTAGSNSQHATHGNAAGAMRLRTRAIGSAVLSVGDAAGAGGRRIDRVGDRPAARRRRTIGVGERTGAGCCRELTIRLRVVTAIVQTVRLEVARGAAHRQGARAYTGLSDTISAAERERTRSNF